ncbi:Dynein light chain Tctex-type [Parelaphostrongylus tenuis]|uniref:Dynein light chain n=1 Tax=Parelaphostrongylus tenuis TaxID=148309 RepID=A0AAD5M0Y0_PARTN|nr:Dynein light chain Tctex-type [Parelaphostrongylus tenuis]
MAQIKREEAGTVVLTLSASSTPLLNNIVCDLFYRNQAKMIKENTPKKMVDRKAVIKNADMSEDMQQDAIDCATQALEKYNIEKDIAAYIKKEFDKKYNPTWHCIVGRNFGSYVTHETKHFIYFYLGQVAILLFKSG